MWVFPNKKDAINCNNLAHMWVEKGSNGFFLMGEMIHNSEQVVLSNDFSNEEDCAAFLHQIIKRI